MEILGTVECTVIELHWIFICISFGFRVSLTKDVEWKYYLKSFKIYNFI